MDEDDLKPALPESLAAAWGIREPSRRGPRPGLSLEKIVNAGIAVASEGGLDAVSMNRVAAELGASTMSLYRYVATKDELLSLMADGVSIEGLNELSIEGGWRTGLTNWANGQLAICRRHPWMLRIPLSGPPVTPNRVRWMEMGLRCLDDTGLSELEKLQTILLITGFIWMYVSMEADMLIVAQDSSDFAIAAMQDYGKTLASLIDRERFPAITAVIEAGLFDGSAAIESELSDEIAFGMERILDGIGILVEARKG